MTSPDASPDAVDSAPAAAPRPAGRVPAPPDLTVPEPTVPDPTVPGPTLPEPILPEQSREDTDAAWGEYSEPADDRLYRDRPPHWADY